MSVQSQVMLVSRIALIVFMSSAGYFTAQAGIRDSLVGWWALDAGTGTTAVDSSGKGNAGTLVNSPQWIAGEVGPGALLLNGTSQYINAGTSTALAGGAAVTVSAWIKPAAVSGYIASRRASWALSWEFYLSNGNVKFGIAVGAGSNADATASSATVIQANGNVWTHVAATYTTADGSLRVYINGAADGTATNGSPIASPAGLNTLIGADARDISNFFNGALDDVRIYNRALSVAEIAALYALGNTQSSGPTAYYIDFAAGDDTYNGLTTSTPWKHAPGDINATAKATSTTLFPGDTVRFKGGVKYVLGQINLNWSGSSGAPIVYDGNAAGTWGTGKAILTDNHASPGHTAFSASGARSNLVFRSFNITELGGAATLPADPGSAIPPNGGAGIVFNSGCSAILIADCDFSELGYYFNQKPMDQNSIDGCGIQVVNFNQVTIRNCDLSKVNIAINAGGSYKNLDIASCKFHDNIRWCVDLPVGSAKSSVDSIAVHDCRFYDYYQFDQTYWTGYGEWPHTDGIFYRCDFDSCTFGPTVNFYNNFFYATQSGGGGTASIYITEGECANVYNNVFMYTGKTRTIMLANGPMSGGSPQVVNIFNNTIVENYQMQINIGDGGRPVQTVNVMNNVFYDTYQGSSNNRILYFTPSNTAYAEANWHFDYNCYKSFNTAGAFFMWPGVGEGGLAAMQTHGWETHGKAVDPLFIDMTHTGAGTNLNDLRLQATSPAKDAGINPSKNWPGYNADKNGVSRPQGAGWDMGAYEYTTIGVRTVDCGLRNEKNKISLPSPITISDLRRYALSAQEMTICDLAGNKVDKNNLRQGGIYLIGRAEGGVIQKVVVVQ